MDNWISVDDRLPEMRRYVLILCENGKMFVAMRYSLYLTNVPWFWTTGQLKKVELDVVRYTVVFWQPLPEPPKQECTCHFFRAVTTGHQWNYCPKCGKGLK